MIKYDNTSPNMIWRVQGSNLPRAFVWSMPSVVMAVFFHYMLEAYPERFTLFSLESFNFSAVWSASVIVLSMLLSLRTNRAYGRFWEGITLVQVMRAEWFETASNLIAFSLVAIKQNSSNEKLVNDVRAFQFTLVRLMSLMQGKALRAVGGHEEEFEVLDIQALDHKSLGYLKACEDGNEKKNKVDPVEVVLHWIQVLVIDAHVDGVIPVPAPILTRVFQTLSRGMVNCHNARKLADVPFPYPLSQMVFVLLMIHSIITPLIIAAIFRDPVFAAASTLVPLMGMWSITFTASELEQPFGNDANDLPLTDIQRHYNLSLMMLLDQETYFAPSLVDQSPLTVKSLRRKHTVNVKDGTSLTDSLPAWFHRRSRQSLDSDSMTVMTTKSTRSAPAEDVANSSSKLSAPSAPIKKMTTFDLSNGASDFVPVGSRQSQGECLHSQELSYSEEKTSRSEKFSAKISEKVSYSEKASTYSSGEVYSARLNAVLAQATAYSTASTLQRRNELASKLERKSSSSTRQESLPRSGSAESHRDSVENKMDDTMFPIKEASSPDHERSSHDYERSGHEWTQLPKRSREPSPVSLRSIGVTSPVVSLGGIAFGQVAAASDPDISSEEISERIYSRGPLLEARVGAPALGVHHDEREHLCGTPSLEYTSQASSRMIVDVSSLGLESGGRVNSRNLSPNSFKEACRAVAEKEALENLHSTLPKLLSDEQATRRNRSKERSARPIISLDKSSPR